MTISSRLREQLVTLFRNTCSLTTTLAHVVELGTTNVTAFLNFDLVDDWRVHWELTLNAYTERSFTNSEGFRNAGTLAGQYIAFENLNTLSFTFNNVDVNCNGVTRTEVWDIVTNSLLIQLLNKIHGVCS